MAEPTQPPYPSGQLRDRLANERTLLAWIRTSIALMGFGLVVAKFSLFLDMLAAAPIGVRAHSSNVAHRTGMVLILVGVVVVVAGTQRTLAYARLIDPEGRSPGSAVLIGAAGLVIAFGVMLALYLALA